MKIVALGSSGTVATVAVVQDETVIAEYSMNYKKTHSETLLPMLDEIKRNASIELEDIDAVAVCAGPGSFTGLRIGAATAKGLALALDKPIVPVPTCEGLAYNMWGFDGIICPIVDARRGQVYTGIYRMKEETDEGVTFSDYTLERLMDQDAMDIHELMEKLEAYNERVCFLGDGVPVFKEEIKACMKSQVTFAPPQLSHERAASIAALAERYMAEGKAVPSDDFAPVYLRKSQAEREREKKLSEEDKTE
jgi:tRNA threonylcarbamoyladenosine biosynthesis protein TsaB